MRARIQHLPKAVRNFVRAHQNAAGFPRVVTLRGILPAGCRFEVSTPVEAYRIERYGDELEFTSRIIGELQPGDVFFDIGASVGLVAVHAAMVGASVVAFEPDRPNRERLVRNLGLNPCDQVTIVEWAAADSPGEAALYTEGVNGRAPALRAVGERQSVRVLTDTIDNAVDRGALPAPDVMKIDIEGAEILALRGARRLLSSDQAPRAIFIEVHSTFLPAFGATSDDVHALLDAAGYQEKYAAERANEIHYLYRRAG